MRGTRALIPHIDDLGVTHGTVVAFDELTRHGAVTSGSVIVPAPWFPAVAALARRRPDLDLGVHLTLTSESAAMRWRPLTTGDEGSGLTDETGFFWAKVQDVRDNADPDAVAAELRAQITRALDAGIDVTHLDHHMGAALNPEFAEITVALAREFGVPVVFPRRIGEYFTLLGKGPVDVARMERLRDELDVRSEIVVDHFVMGLEVRDVTARDVYMRLVAEATDGVTFVALHCTAPGDIQWVHPKDHARRIEEYELFGDAAFIAWLSGQPLTLTGFRELA